MISSNYMIRDFISCKNELMFDSPAEVNSFTFPLKLHAEMLLLEFTIY